MLCQKRFDCFRLMTPWRKTNNWATSLFPPRTTRAPLKAEQNRWSSDEKPDGSLRMSQWRASLPAVHRTYFGVILEVDLQNTSKQLSSRWYPGMSEPADDTPPGPRCSMYRRHRPRIFCFSRTGNLCSRKPQRRDGSGCLLPNLMLITQTIVFIIKCYFKCTYSRLLRHIGDTYPLQASRFWICFLNQHKRTSNHPKRISVSN